MSFFIERALMAGKPKTELSEKQWKAIKMFESGAGRSDIEKALGFSDSYLSALIQGDISKAGQVADLFKKEWQKIDDKRDQRIKDLIKENTELVQSQLKRVAKEVVSKKKLTATEKHWLIKANTSLTGNKPSVNIKSLSYSYTQGLSVEDLFHEYQRLTAIAEESFKRRPVQSIEPAGPGCLPGESESGS